MSQNCAQRGHIALLPAVPVPHVCGIDEAGRGRLAGPVTAAVLFAQTFLFQYSMILKSSAQEKESQQQRVLHKKRLTGQ